MISQRQHEANRRNAAKSRGPITPEGRAAVRMNALKHGLTAADIILPTVEEKINFEQFRFALIDECQPVGLIEALLVEDMVTARWRMNRARKMEPGFFAYRQADLKRRMEYFAALDAQAHLAFIMCHDAQNSDTLGKISRYEARFERTFLQSPEGAAAASSTPRRSVRFWEWDCFANSDFTRSRPCCCSGSRRCRPRFRAGSRCSQPCPRSRPQNPTVSAGDRPCGRR